MKEPLSGIAFQCPFQHAEGNGKNELSRCMCICGEWVYVYIPESMFFLYFLHRDFVLSFIRLFPFFIGERCIISKLFSFHKFIEWVAALWSSMWRRECGHCNGLYYFVINLLDRKWGRITLYFLLALSSYFSISVFRFAFYPFPIFIVQLSFERFYEIFSALAVMFCINLNTC